MTVLVVLTVSQSFFTNLTVTNYFFSHRFSPPDSRMSRVCMWSHKHKHCIIAGQYNYDRNFTVIASQRKTVQNDLVFTVSITSQV